MAGIDQVFSDSFTSKKIFGNDGFQFFLFQKRWKNIVGDMLAKESYIKSWKDDTLVIAVTNSVFLQHLFMMKGDLLKRLFEDKFGKRFKDIRFIAGPRQKKEKAYSTLDPVNHKIEEEQKMYSQDLTEGEEKWIENWAAWVLIDGTYILLYGIKSMWLFALLYLLFTIMAFYGWLKWRKEAV